MKQYLEGFQLLNREDLLVVNGGYSRTGYGAVASGPTRYSVPTSTGPSSRPPYSVPGSGTSWNPRTYGAPGSRGGSDDYNPWEDYMVPVGGPPREPSREDWEGRILRSENNPRRLDMTWANSEREREQIRQKYNNFRDSVSGFGGSTQAFQEIHTVKNRIARSHTIVNTTTGVTARLIDIGDDGSFDALSFTRTGER